MNVALEVEDVLTVIDDLEAEAEQSDPLHPPEVPGGGSGVRVLHAVR